MKGRENSLKINCFSHTLKNTVGPLLSGQHTHSSNTHRQAQTSACNGVNMFWSALEQNVGEGGAEQGGSNIFLLEGVPVQGHKCC